MKGVTVLIYKNCIKTGCNSYHCILLLSVSFKISYNTLLLRLNPYVNKVTGGHQCGFWQNRSTADHIFPLYQVLEKRMGVQFDSTSAIYRLESLWFS